MLVITPSTEAGGFSGQLCGIPLAYVLWADIPARAEGPLVHDLSGRNVPVERASAGAAVQALAKRLDLDRAADRAGLRGASRIDQHDVGSGACSLEPDELDEQRPRGVMDGFGRYPALESGEVKIFEREVSVS
ncbi:hypothetical protein QO001_006484 [Methylobacterium brachiatum]|uniref:Uncharacterized protein n=1 Tax=Methylobacterium brachiatum TaxID=269660 RepID=A0AAJ1WZZ2_9HYPH|nr:hypothetical protein [Methylobacterium brachiatum]